MALGFLCCFGILSFATRPRRHDRKDGNAALLNQRLTKEEERVTRAGTMSSAVPTILLTIRRA